MSDSSTLLPLGPPLVVAIVLSALVAAAVAALARLREGAAVLRAGLRAVVQLGAVSLSLLRGCPGLQAGEESNSCGAGQGAGFRPKGETPPT
ncbi:hypothetical protein HNR23_001838 [Nocardiopsis mwathae]|uniref:Uncharacterized protein n=1 Tax=Nocardiopsis mwathae TaxID=1472723 RepID=A0A7W9YGN3_9ACTN|nr:hypothetical protein [Nocardiopsis mwathae]MBB6171778.1 hypothetical protein [Nocardiopsis mwathae]